MPSKSARRRRGGSPNVKAEGFEAGENAVGVGTGKPSAIDEYTESIATPMATASPWRRLEVGHRLRAVRRPVAEVERAGFVRLERIAAERDVPAVPLGRGRG